MYLGLWALVDPLLPEAGLVDSATCLILNINASYLLRQTYLGYLHLPYPKSSFVLYTSISKHAIPFNAGKPLIHGMQKETNI